MHFPRGLTSAVNGYKGSKTFISDAEIHIEGDVWLFYFSNKWCEGREFRGCRRRSAEPASRAFFDADDPFCRVCCYMTCTLRSYVRVVPIGREYAARTVWWPLRGSQPKYSNC